MSAYLVMGSTVANHHFAQREQKAYYNRFFARIAPEPSGQEISSCLHDYFEVGYGFTSDDVAMMIKIALSSRRRENQLVKHALHHALGCHFDNALDINRLLDILATNLGGYGRDEESVDRIRAGM